MATDNIKIKQTWIEENIDEIERDFESRDEAFMHLAVSLLFDIDTNSVDPEDIIDGGSDKQIDIIRINDNHEQGVAEIDIIQVKNKPGFSSTVLINIRNGLKWIFEKKKADYI